MGKNTKCSKGIKVSPPNSLKNCASNFPGFFDSESVLSATENACLDKNAESSISTSYQEENHQEEVNYLGQAPSPKQNSTTSLFTDLNTSDYDSSSSVRTEINFDRELSLDDEDEGSIDRKGRPSTYKAYHRQIEKRRRNKISSLINEIGSFVPMCMNATHRLDKLSILELAVQQVSMVSRSSEEGYTCYKPSFLSKDEIGFLIDQNGFLLVLSLDKARILHVSVSISDCTNHEPPELLGRSLLDIIHPNDKDLVSSMLIPYQNIPTVGTSSTFTGQGITGTRRSFYCRLKTTKQPSFNSAEASGSHRYSHKIGGSSFLPVKMTGFLKTWQHNKNNNSDTPPNKASKMNATKQASRTFFICLVKPATTPINHISNHEMFSGDLRTDDGHKGVTDKLKLFSSKHSVDAKYLSVDQAVFSILGYLPQDLIGNSEYNFVHEDDVKLLSDTYQKVLDNNNNESVVSDVYRLKMKHGGNLPVRTIASSFLNPFTHELEFITHQNYVMGDVEEERIDLSVATMLKEQKSSMANVLHDDSLTNFPHI